jgi:2-oxoglutarate dehydrogenase E1 component
VSQSLIDIFRASSHIAPGNAAFVEGLYELWLSEPERVAPEWRRYFESIAGTRPNDLPHGPLLRALADRRERIATRIALPAGQDTVFANKQAGVLRLLTAFRSRGHLHADIDPLGLWEKPPAPDLELAFHGLSEADLETEFETGSFAGPARMKLRDFRDWLRRTYTGTIGAEFMHISDAAQRRWFYERLERAGGRFGFDPGERRRILDRLTAAEGLERYLHTKYVGQKRFSLEGGDSLIPLLDELVRQAGAHGVRELVIGMAHRGRLNVLVNVLGKPPHELFAEFEGRKDQPRDPARSGDVKYHLGYSSDIRTPGGTVHLALGFNPSHLEIIDPVIAGSVRARQTRRGDQAREQVVPLLIHGDAAFSGQGVVAELFNMSQARGFTVGGTIHVVVNNQIGFTVANPQDARSTLYCTDVAKIVNAPVLHVNGDDPEAVVFCARLAFEYRKTFKRDVVIDLVCYRRHGHNEADEPAATQPLMYRKIRAHKSTRQLYAEKLAAEGIATAEEAAAMSEDYRKALEEGRILVEQAPAPSDAFLVDWSPHLGADLCEKVASGVERDRLLRLGSKLSELPEDFELHPRVAKIMEERRRMTEGEIPLDWGFAELLAYATLLEEGFKLRLVGQDSQRGTFFHRHAVLHDQKTGRTHAPLAAIRSEPGAVCIVDSLLSEEAVLGYEYGYATADPKTLVIWEAQFGDFANGAQVVIDQFITSGEAKWGRLCGIVLFLPHGYEGQGPEHSSARLERFLQLCALENVQVCVPTTPAQMFHMLRRQMLRRARKPLIVMTPKSLLRHRLSVSSLQDLAEGCFRELIPDPQPADAFERIVLCAGKVYYEIFEERERRGLSERVALIRVEQLYPFPRALLAAELSRLGHVSDVVWCQEEPMNQGAWFQIRHHLSACLAPGQRLHYAGRPRSPAPASGYLYVHLEEQAALIEAALASPLNGEHAPE